MILDTHFIGLLHFLTVDMPGDQGIPLILGRPLYLTSRCDINLEKSTLALKVYDDEISLNMLENRKQKEEK